MRCPKTVITPQSSGLLETFQVWKALGTSDIQSMSAREVDALLVLEQELQAERNDAKQAR